MSQTYGMPIDGADTLTASRTNINSAFDALLTSFSGGSAPGSPVLGQIWLDTSTTPDSLKIYDGSSFVTIASDITTAGGGNLPTSGGTMSGAIAMGSNKITAVDDGTNAGDAVNLGQVDARERVALVRIGDVSATGNYPIWCGAPAVTLTEINVVVQTAITGDNTNYWGFAVYNQQDAADVLAADRETTVSGGGFSALTSESLGSFASGKAALDADDVLQLQITKTASAADLDELLVSIKYTVAT